MKEANEKQTEMYFSGMNRKHFALQCKVDLLHTKHGIHLVSVNFCMLVRASKVGTTTEAAPSVDRLNSLFIELLAIIVCRTSMIVFSILSPVCLVVNGVAS